VSRWATKGARVVVGAAAMTAVLSGCGDDGGDDVAGFCEKNEEFENESEQLFEGALSATDDAGLEDAKQAFADANDLLAELADEAPDDIKDDVETVASAFDEANEEIQGAESVEDLQGLDGGAIDSEETDAAADRVETWTQDNCDSGGGSGSDTTEG
jgi:hypothetical protein